MKDVKLVLIPTRVKNKIIIEIKINVSCFLCSYEGYGRPLPFEDLDKLLRHIRANHNKHFMAKNFKNGIIQLQSVIEECKK